MTIEKINETVEIADTENTETSVETSDAEMATTETHQSESAAETLDAEAPTTENTAVSTEVAVAEEIFIPDLKYKLEGIIFAAQKTMSVKQLRSLFPVDETPSLQQIQNTLDELQQDYAERGVRLERIASGYCFRATALIAPYVGELMGEKPVRYSRAMMETLAIIAYRQPITRGEIEQIRGVAVSSHILKTLLEREWIKSVGYKEVPGKPELFATTKDFLDYFHLQHLSDLPELKDLLEQDPQAAEKVLEEQLMNEVVVVEEVAGEGELANEEVASEDELASEEVASEDELASEEVVSEDELASEEDVASEVEIANEDELDSAEEISEKS
jgi:segregation and condensation protein B